MTGSLWTRPELLPLAVALIVTTWSAFRRRESRRRALRDHLGTDHPSSPAQRSRLPRAAGWALAGAALLGPVLSTSESTDPGDRLTLWIGWDLSASMAAAAPVSRFDAGRAATRDLLSGLSGLRVGIAVFGDEAHVLLPPTSDLDVVDAFVDGLEPGLLRGAGSSSDAVAALVELVASDRPGTSDGTGPDPVMLLVTDGEWEGAAPAPDGRTVVHALWTDTPRVVPVSELPGMAAASGAGRASETVARSEDLLDWTRRTGGVLATASDPASVEALRLALVRAGLAARHPAPRREPVDATPVFALAAALLLLSLRRPEGVR